MRNGNPMMHITADILLRNANEINKKNKQYQCSNILKAGLESINRRGGGRPDMAQGSGESNNFKKFPPHSTFTSCLTVN